MSGTPPDLSQAQRVVTAIRIGFRLTRRQYQNIHIPQRFNWSIFHRAKVRRYVERGC